MKIYSFWFKVKQSQKDVLKKTPSYKKYTILQIIYNKKLQVLLTKTWGTF